MSEGLRISTSSKSYLTNRKIENFENGEKWSGDMDREVSMKFGPDPSSTFWKTRVNGRRMDGWMTDACTMTTSSRAKKDHLDLIPTKFWECETIFAINIPVHVRFAPNINCSCSHTVIVDSEHKVLIQQTCDIRNTCNMAIKIPCTHKWCM